MKTLLVLVCSLSAWGQPVPTGALPHALGNGFSVTYSVAVDRTKMGSSTLSNFPVEISASGITAFKATGSGGSVTNGSGYDIIVATDTTCSTLIPWEVEFWDGTSGAWVAWAKLASVNGSAAASNTTFAVCVGKSSISSQQNTGSYARTAVWTGGYTAVYHLPSLSLSDSTSNGFTLTNSGVAAGTGQIDGGAYWASGGDYLSTGSITGGTSANTISAWVRTSNSPGSGNSQAIVYSRTNGIWGPAIGGSPYYANCTFGYSNSGWAQIINTTAMNDGAWHHVACVWSGTQASMYVDGAQFGSSVAATAAPPSTILYDIGYDPSGSNPYFVGYIDEPRIQSAARSADWILSEYNNQKNPGNVGAANFLVWVQQ